MKKIILFILLSIAITTFNLTPIFATSFSIVDGLKFSDKKEVTFDKSRSIVGTAEQNSLIVIEIYEKLPKKYNPLNFINSYKTVVGASGYFNINVDLIIGENVIKITSTNDDDEVIYLSTTIKCKSNTVKYALEKITPIYDFIE